MWREVVQQKLMRAAQTLWVRLPVKVRGFILATEIGALTVEAPSLHDQEVPTITVEQLVKAVQEREGDREAIREAERMYG